MPAVPIWDFICENCKEIKLDVFVLNGAAQPRCCGQQMLRMAAAPSFVVRGLNAQNGYSSARTFKQKIAGVETTVTGTPEAFSDSIISTAVKPKERKE